MTRRHQSITYRRETMLILTTNSSWERIKNYHNGGFGPYLVKRVINEQNVDLQISPKREQIHSAYRLKKFIDPKRSKFLDQESLKRERSNTQSTEFNPSHNSQNQKTSNEEIKVRIEQRITRSRYLIILLSLPLKK
jgi:hypothetical protein